MALKNHNPLTVAIAGVVLACGAAVASDEGHRVANQIDQESYRFMLDNLMYAHDGNDRGIERPDHDPARDNIQVQFESFGLSAWIEEFSQWGLPGYNVVAEITGTTRPDEVYIIGGHYDSANNPGADDNASGVVAVMEAARVISRYESEATIRFIAFDMEELGLIGSGHYASDHAPENIRGMIAVDMIAYDPNDADQALVCGSSASDPIKQALIAAAQEYGPITAADDGSHLASDHVPFQDRGFQACLLIEHDVGANARYHTARDSVDEPGYINYRYATQMTRTVAGWLTDAAGVRATCAADFNGDGVVNSQDFILFLNAFASGDPAADFNADGAVNSQDFIAFLNAFVAGC